MKLVRSAADVVTRALIDAVIAVSCVMIAAAVGWIVYAIVIGLAPS